MVPYHCIQYLSLYINSVVSYFLFLQAGDDAQGVQWQRISGKIPLYASHTAMLKKVAELHDASF